MGHLCGGTVCDMTNRRCRSRSCMQVSVHSAGPVGTAVRGRPSAIGGHRPSSHPARGGARCRTSSPSERRIALLPFHPATAARRSFLCRLQLCDRLRPGLRCGATAPCVLRRYPSKEAWRAPRYAVCMVECRAAVSCASPLRRRAAMPWPSAQSSGRDAHAFRQDKHDRMALESPSGFDMLAHPRGLRGRG